jgi:hypothetical protein
LDELRKVSLVALVDPAIERDSEDRDPHLGKISNLALAQTSASADASDASVISSRSEALRSLQ